MFSSCSKQRRQGREGGREGGRERDGGMVENVTALKYFLSQKRDLLTDCQGDGHTYGQSDHEE